MMRWSRTFSFPHRLARDADELETSWRHEQPRSKQIWNRFPGRESSVTHDGERTGWKCLASSHRAVEPGASPSETWSAQLVNADASKEGGTYQLRGSIRADLLSLRQLLFLRMVLSTGNRKARLLSACSIIDVMHVFARIVSCCAFSNMNII